MISARWRAVVAGTVAKLSGRPADSAAPRLKRRRRFGSEYRIYEELTTRMIPPKGGTPNDPKRCRAALAAALQDPLATATGRVLM